MLPRLLLVAALLGGCDARAPAVRPHALGGAHALWVDLDGATITAGGDDAAAGSSALGSAAVPAFDPAVVAPDVSAASVRAVLIDRVRTLYRPFDLDVVDARPSSGDYARVVVGGTPAVLTPPAPAMSVGLATLDCPDANPRSVGFAFAATVTPKFGGVVALAATIAHEAGHGYGLEHVLTPRDPMYAVGVPMQDLDDVFHYAFSTGTYSTYSAGGPVAEQCGRADPLDDVALLTATLGTRAATSAAPTVAIALPPPILSAPTTLPVHVTAADDVAVRRVEIYRDLALVAAIDAPPYETTLTLPAAAATTITVEAIDDEAQRATTSITFQVDPGAPAVCDEAVPCASPLACLANRCVIPPAPMDAGVDAGPANEDGGCSMGGTRSVTPEAAIVALLLFIWIRAARCPLPVARRPFSDPSGNRPR
jgi:hypothetical protein